jgi:hypothetical protein
VCPLPEWFQPVRYLLLPFVSYLLGLPIATDLAADRGRNISSSTLRCECPAIGADLHGQRPKLRSKATMALSQQYKNFGANMLPGHAVNHGTNTNSVEPALSEMREMIFGGKLTIAGHNHELLRRNTQLSSRRGFRQTARRPRVGRPLRGHDEAPGQAPDRMRRHRLWQYALRQAEPGT